MIVRPVGDLERSGQEIEVLSEGEGEVQDISTDIVVHTKDTPTLMAASLWPCLQSPASQKQSLLEHRSELQGGIMGVENVVYHSQGQNSKKFGVSA